MKYVSREYHPEGCWIWTGTIRSNGYGAFKNDRAYRKSVEIFYGPIQLILNESGYYVTPHIDHVCHTRALAAGECRGGTTCLHRRCVNPLHLEPVTPLENSQRRQRSNHITIPNGWTTATRLKAYLPDANAAYIHELLKENVTHTSIYGRVIYNEREALDMINIMLGTP